MNWDNRKNFRILLGGYININVIDGSAFFLSGFAGMCARQPYVHVDLVTANPVKSWEVLDELAEYNNVDIVDPYSITQGHPEFLGRNHMTRQEYASVLVDMFDKGDYDCVLIRDNEVAQEFLKNAPNARGRTFAYITGLAFLHEKQDAKQLDMIRRIVELGANLVCQTDEIKHLVQTNVAVTEEDIFILPPHVPDPDPGALDSLKQVQEPHRLVYTGKFFWDWKIDSILASVKAVNLDNSDLHLDVAGDQFRHTDKDQYFVENVSYLLKNTEAVKWHGRVPRNVSRSLIAKSHVGIGWRSEKLEASSELSTKILEYGALGRPSIINRTPMHEKLLGADYPLYVNSMEEFRVLLEKLRRSREDILEAAQRCFELAHKHGYSSVSAYILPSMGNTPNEEASVSYINGSSLTAEIPKEIFHRRARAGIHGIWVNFVFDETSDYTVGHLASDVENDFKSWHRALRVTRSRVEALSKSDNLGSLGQNNQSVRLESQDYENVKTLRGSLNAATQELEKLERDFEKSRRELGKALERELYWKEHSKQQTSRLNALRESKLGRLQTRFWQGKN